MAFGTEQSQTPVVCVLHRCSSAIAVPPCLSRWEALLLTRPAVLLCLPFFLLLLLLLRVMRAALPAAAAAACVLVPSQHAVVHPVHRQGPSCAIVNVPHTPPGC
jgi:hypothetical protein